MRYLKPDFELLTLDGGRSLDMGELGPGCGLSKPFEGTATRLVILASLAACSPPQPSSGSALERTSAHPRPVNEHYGKADRRIPTVRSRDQLRPAPTPDKPAFHAGMAMLRQPWVRAPSSTDRRDGLGPLFNARSCVACHPGGGRGDRPLVRIYRSTAEGPVPDPIYGGQLQSESVDLRSYLRIEGPPGWLKPEAKVDLRWKPAFVEGWKVRSPKLSVEPNYGALHQTGVVGARVGPSLVGTFELEKIPEDVILAVSDPNDQDGDGISGRPRRLGHALGRYGHKAGQPSLSMQVGSALLHDMGLTNPYGQDEPCPNQSLCSRFASGADPESGLEVDARRFAMMMTPLKQAQPPKPPPPHPLFSQAGCLDCHRLFPQASLYSDLLLHDLGPALADGDGITEFEREWRTAPLHGTGRQANFLHDGRARSHKEAILWHGGEAQKSRRAFLVYSKAEQAALLSWMKTL